MVLPSDLAASIQAYAESFTALMALVALGAGVIQIFYVRVGNRNNAESLWREYERLALDHPRMAKPEESVVDMSIKPFDGSHEKFTRYEYFVSILLWAGESILQVYNRQYDWKASVGDEIALHEIYLTSEYFKPSLDRTTKRRMRELITKKFAVQGEAT
jgi:hypothetical protein